MAAFYRLCFRLSQIGAVVACCMLIYMVAQIMLEIVLRSVFHTSTFVADEMVGYALSAFVFWSFGYALESGSLIRVTVLTQHLSAAATRVVFALGAFASLIVVLKLADTFWMRTSRAYSRGTVSSSIAAVPTWIAEAIMLGGLVLLAIQLFAYGLRQLTGHASPAQEHHDTLVE